MNKARGDWCQLRQLWPLAVAVLAACGGASEPADNAVNTDETVTATTSMESAEGRRRSSWVYCAAEGATCAVPSTRLVRYGANGAYYYKTVSGSIACNNSAWGDPAVGVAKKCDYATSTSTAAPAPAPVPPPGTTGSATLTWTPSVSSSVSGYRVYWGTASRSYGQALGLGAPVGTVTSYTVVGLPVGATYYFALTTVDAADNESALSVEATKVVQ